MTRQHRRRPDGGRIDRSRVLRFRFDGREFDGYQGDTLASALLANGVRIVGRSFKYHRPRGILGAGAEDPNALVQLGEGPRSDPNARATEVELYDGLVARAVNCWPSVRFDIGAINDRLSRFLAAGFYYKTFMWPSWRAYEWAIRRAAGLGRAPSGPDPDRYEARYAHCDLLVVGGGPAGLAAARAAASSGARVILCEQDFELGGRLLWDEAEVAGRPGGVWAGETQAELLAEPECTILTRTTAVGFFDHNALALVERVASYAKGEPRDGALRFRLWQVRAKQVILATGSIERPLVFPGNDRPGVMLARAAHHYLGRYAARAGDRAVLFTNNDSAYAMAFAYAADGAATTVIDTRTEPPPHIVERLNGPRIRLIAGGVVVATHGRPALRAITVRHADGALSRLACDLLGMSGGANPTIHLHCQSGGRPVFDPVALQFVPGRPVQAEQSVGAAAGLLDLSKSLRQAHRAGAQAATAIGFPASSLTEPSAAERPESGIAPCWHVDAPGKAFVDFQNDVTRDDIALAARENFVSIEHLKRYTTLGMAVDQGKTSNVNALAIMAELTDCAVPQVGTTRFRFPFSPVPLAAFAGRQLGALYRPRRLLPAHDWHMAQGAVFEDLGSWQRPAYYKHDAETGHDAEQREALTVRERAGLFDASPLGKIEVKGPDAAAFLDRIYANAMSPLKVGRLRYGLMLNEHGVIIDDGVTARLGEEHFLVGTTGVGADSVAEWLEEWHQFEWPDLDLIIAPVTTSWAVATLAGPNARRILDAADADFPLSPDAFPHMTFRVGHVAGIPARVSRVSFTGELSYEVGVPASRATELWAALLSAGRPFGLEPVGIDAWMLLRTEKGYIHIGADTDGTTCPSDIGWGRVSSRAGDFIGRRSLSRAEACRNDRRQLVGLEATEPTTVLPVGAHLCGGDRRAHSASAGFVTSSGFSPILRRGVALAMVRGGRVRMDDIVQVEKDMGRVEAKVVAPGAYDPKGERLRD